MSTSKLTSPEEAIGEIALGDARSCSEKKQTRSGSSLRQSAARTTKKAVIRKLLRRKRGATLTALQDATGWQRHSLRAAVTGLRKSGVEIERATNAKGETVYRTIGS